MISRRTALLFLLSSLACGCDEPAHAPRLVERAALGVFFGGQIQERDQLPFTLDRSKQTQGFRLEFSQPLARPLVVRWEVDRPSGRGRQRLTELGQAEVRAGSERFDQELPFQPGQALGTWNYRVIVDKELVIDRPVLVYDAASRKKAEREEGQASSR